jgi:hypothetical protein
MVTMRLLRLIATSRLILAVALALAAASTADARSRHSRHQSHGANHDIAAGRADEHGKNPQVRAASEEVDKIGGKIKNICRGC